METCYESCSCSLLVYAFNRHFQLEKCETIYKLARMNLSKIICLEKKKKIEILKFNHFDKSA